MKSILSLMAIAWIQSAPCEHRTAGSCVEVELDRIEKGYRDTARGLAVAVESAVRIPDPLGRSFDSKLPACRSRETRRSTIAAVPPELMGRRVYFGTERKGDLWIATSARQLRDIAGAVPASRELADRLGVRCVPALVTVRSRTEVDIVEE